MAPTSPKHPAPRAPRRSSELVALRLPNRALAAAIQEAWAAGKAVFPLGPDGSDDLDERFGGPVEPDIGALVLTSGSTGESRAVELSWDSLHASADATNRRLGVSRGDRWLCPVPVHHIAGLQILVRSERASLEPQVVMNHFDVDEVAGAEANLVSLVPTMLVRLLDAGVDLSRFKAILLGGAALAPSLLQRAREGGAPIVRSYGMTETCGGCVYDGAPLEGVDLRIEASGEITLSGPVLFSRYRGEPALTAERLDDGWFRTADAGTIENGRLRVLGRVDELINTGGEKVSPVEVAGLLTTHPAVAHAEVVGVPDPEWGERVVAIVEAAGKAPTLAEVRAFLATRTEGFKVPKELVVVKDWPRRPSGKVDRRRLADYLRVDD